MPINIQQIRELNKVKFYVSCMTQPNINSQGYALDDSYTGSGGTYSTWGFGMYSQGGIQFGGAVAASNWLAKLSTNGLMAGVASTLMATTGVVPQLDVALKARYGGTSPQSFDMKCYLVLEDDVVKDLYAPMLYLLMLTYPSRIGETSIQDWVKSMAAEMQEEAVADKNNMWAQGKSILMDALDWLAAKATIVVGQVYTMQVPPPFYMGLLDSNGGKTLREKLGGTNKISVGGYTAEYVQVGGGTGLAMRYGSSYIEDVFIKELRFSIPQLYYAGGYPQVIEVNMKVETLRVTTANSLAGMLGIQTAEEVSKQQQNRIWAEWNRELMSEERAAAEKFEEDTISPIEYSKF